MRAGIVPILPVSDRREISATLNLKWHITLTTSLIQVLENGISEALREPKGVYEKGADTTLASAIRKMEEEALICDIVIHSGHAIVHGQHNAKEQIAGIRRDLRFLTETLI
jgi:hypothetical protein